MKATDYLLDDDGDLRIEDGDLVVGYSDHQHAKDILLASPGHWRQWPTLGVNYQSYVNADVTGETINEFRKAVELNFTIDKLRIIEMNVPNFKDFTIKVDR